MNGMGQGVMSTQGFVIDAYKASKERCIGCCLFSRVHQLDWSMGVQILLADRIGKSESRYDERKSKKNYCIYTVSHM